MLLNLQYQRAILFLRWLCGYCLREQEQAKRQKDDSSATGVYAAGTKGTKGKGS